MQQSYSSSRTTGQLWLLALGAVLAAVGYSFGAAQENDTPVQGSPNVTQTVPFSIGGGGTADSNGRMIAVTGMDLTGQAVLYVIDTESFQLAVYQASGGGKSTQGIKLVGARRIDLDLQLAGFNDKTESEGRPLPYKALEDAFKEQGLLTGEDR